MSLSRTLKYKEKEISKLKRKTESNKNETHSFLTLKMIHKNGCVYLYLLQMIFPEYPVLPLYLKLNASPKFTVENLSEMFKLGNVINDLNLLCFCISADGDNGIDHYHIHAFESFDELIDENNSVIAVPKSAYPIIDIMSSKHNDQDFLGKIYPFLHIRQFLNDL